MANVKIKNLPAGTVVGTNRLPQTNTSVTTYATWNQVLAFIIENVAGSPYVIGDLIYADSISTLNKISDIVAGNVLLSGGVGFAPFYGKVGLTTHVTGILPVNNGGTGQDSFTNGQLLIGNTSGNTLSVGNLIGGSGISISNNPGSITITNTGALTQDSAYGEMYFQGNSTNTIISTLSTPVKINAIYNSGELFEFTQLSGTLTYTGSDVRPFLISASLDASLNLTTADITISIFKNGILLSKSQNSSFIGSATPALQAISVQSVTSLTTNDYIEIYIQNDTDTNDILVSNLNMSAISIGGAGSGDQVVVAWDGSTSPVSVTAGTGIDISGGVITNIIPQVVILWDGSASPVNVTAGSGIDITSGVITNTIPQVVTSWDGSSSPLAVTAGSGIDISGGVITNIGSPGSNITLASLSIPTTVYPLNTFTLMWNAISGLNGSNIIQAGTFSIGDTIEVDMIGINTVNITGPNADSGSHFRFSFGSNWTVTSSSIPLSNSTARTRTWSLKIKITRIGSSTVRASAAGFYYDNSQVSKPIELFFTPDAGMPYNASINAPITLEYENGNTFQFYFILKNLEIKQYKL